MVGGVAVVVVVAVAEVVAGFVTGVTVVGGVVVVVFVAVVEVGAMVVASVVVVGAVVGMLVAVAVAVAVIVPASDDVFICATIILCNSLSNLSGYPPFTSVLKKEKIVRHQYFVRQQ